MLISPDGDGRRVIILFNKSSIPTPVFAETREALSVSIPRTSSICDFILSGSEEGRSILFRTGKISWSLLIAWYALANVWASTPCVESTISKDPSHAAKVLIPHRRNLHDLECP